ncbi:BZ3500_MvSof-1268-A1-R1_Chr9g10413 [Microbotryum saponariae]|uniref:BZ3500_MvSof-1268-A1-R1_Chr9g10413 protein n=1 Tax=Microbotryum saponariae TaxID=289078 RepID=A0A2X0MZI4_9BASI|nr:BZ3501_MvSof-1269-A2-R1_Chr9g10163 [Microbotryum saponariae]SDA00052.1 BZ3500_MvSof-1268-A1-R1_Chr9g10413 [Microbotryum saponariae]
MSPTPDERLISIEAQARSLAPEGPLVPLLAPKASYPTRISRDVALHDSSRHYPFGADKHTAWRVDTFVVSAAFPRSFKNSAATLSTSPASSPNALNEDPPTNSTEPTKGRTEPLKTQFSIHEAYIQICADQLEALKQGKVSVDDEQELCNQAQLFIAVNRYVNTAVRPSKDKPLLTLIFAHPNGLHKETWEPAISDVLDAWDSATPIGEVWCLDAFNQGDSACLNQGRLGKTFDWSDHGRDIANFLISYLPDALAPSLSPPHLPFIHTPETTLLQALDTVPLIPGHPLPSHRIFRNRLIVGIGHSLGGAGMAYAATAQPSLFCSLVLFEPILPPPGAVCSCEGLTKGALGRREIWDSKRGMKEGLLKKDFFRKWDERCLELYVEFGSKYLPDGDVGLKCRAQDEAVRSELLASLSRKDVHALTLSLAHPPQLVFCDVQGLTVCRGSLRLPSIPPTLPIHLIIAENSIFPLGSELTKLLNLIPWATHETFEGAGHLLVQERPKDTAEAIVRQLERLYEVAQGDEVESFFVRKAKL